VAVVQTTFVPGGGTEAVTAWTVEALKSDYSVSLISFSQFKTSELNSFYETQLTDNDYTRIQPSLPFYLGKINRFSMPKDHLMMRYCKSIKDDVDLFISIGGGMDLGQRSIQYGAYAPASTLMKVLSGSPGVPKWYSLLKKAIMRTCEYVSHYSVESLNSNITLATSRWIGEEMLQMYDIDDYQVVYPPVNSTKEISNWESRREGFVCVARIVPEKMIDQAIEILSLVRDKGYPVSLHIVGRPDDQAYFKKIQQIQSENSSWLYLHGLLPKTELLALIDENKYGINAASGEPAGISAIEMIKAGCIVFVRDGGGLPEIIDHAELTYHSVDNGVEKIIKVLEEGGKQEPMREHLEKQGQIFSNESFSNAMKNVVDGYFSSQNMVGSDVNQSSSITNMNTDRQNQGVVSGTDFPSPTCIKTNQRQNPRHLENTKLRLLLLLVSTIKVLFSGRWQMMIEWT